MRINKILILVKIKKSKKSTSLRKNLSLACFVKKHFQIFFLDGFEVNLIKPKLLTFLFILVSDISSICYDVRLL